jgi:hypothetical protein
MAYDNCRITKTYFLLFHYFPVLFMLTNYFLRYLVLDNSLD